MKKKIPRFWYMKIYKNRPFRCMGERWEWERYVSQIYYEL